jgi:hypothetical protein
VRYLFALLVGAATGGVAILLHQSLPPFGVATSLLFTFLSIWLIGRLLVARSYKWVAALGWLAVLLRASSFGEGQELLVQGDGVGSTLLLVGTLVALIAVAARS